MACLHSEAARPINSHLSGSDLDRLNRVFQDGIKSNDLQTIFYSAVYGKELDLAAVKEACQRLEKLHADSKLNVSTVHMILFDDEQVLSTCSTSTHIYYRFHED